MRLDFGSVKIFVAMSPEIFYDRYMNEETKADETMIHIRIDRATHRRLRVMAAESDTTIQNIIRESIGKIIMDYAKAAASSSHRSSRS